MGVLLIGVSRGARADGFTVLPKYPLPDSEIKCVVVDSTHGVIYIAGDFTSVSGVTRNNLAAIDASTGALLPWNPNVNNTVFALLLKDGVLYLGGDFTTVDSTARADIAAVAAITDRSSSTVALETFNPACNDSVLALATDGTNIYAGGFFTAIGGQNYAGLAKLDATTGTAVAGWSPNPSAVFTIAVSGTTVYAGGIFATIGGQVRTNVAGIDITTGNVVTSFNPVLDGTSVDLLSVVGTRLYVSGSFTTVDTLLRGHFLAFKTADNTLDGDFDPEADSTVLGMTVDGGTAYVGGRFTTIGGESRVRLAALDLSTGFATGWNPGANNDVNALDNLGGVIFIGARNCTTIGSVTHAPFNFAGVTENAIPPTAPGLVVAGKKKITTTRSKLTLKGATSISGLTSGTVASVTVKVGNKAAKPAVGTTNWTFKASVKPGKNKIVVVATSTAGVNSAPVRLTVTRK